MTPALEPTLLYRRIESVFAGLSGTASPQRFATRWVPRVLDHLGAALAVREAHLYRREADQVRLVHRWGEDGPDLASELRRRIGHAGRADGIAELPWAGRTRAGLTGLVSIGRQETLLVAFVGGGGGSSEEDLTALRPLHATLTHLHFALQQHLRHGELEDIVEQARAIQMSLLPTGRPEFGDFDIAAASLPARLVGGDLYDFLPLDAETMAVTVADASGHGLPAALQARDVAMGLRMGAERDLKITRTVEKLNRIIHRSGLVSRFVSLVFGELELNGNFAYINAGHPPPLLLDGSGFRELSVGGMVLGPQPDAVYKLGFAHLDRGGVMALYTDGVLERGAAAGAEFGAERLRRWMQDWHEGSAHAAVADLLERLKRFGDGGPIEDDVTVVYVRRPA